LLAGQRAAVGGRLAYEGLDEVDELNEGVDGFLFGTAKLLG